MEKEIKKLKNELLDASFMSMAYKVFDNPDFHTILECVQSAPLMFGKTLTLISIDKYLIGNSEYVEFKGKIDKIGTTIFQPGFSILLNFPNLNKIPLSYSSICLIDARIIIPAIISRGNKKPILNHTPFTIILSYIM